MIFPNRGKHLKEIYLKRFSKLIVTHIFQKIMTIHQKAILLRNHTLKGKNRESTRWDRRTFYTKVLSFMNIGTTSLIYSYAKTKDESLVIAFVLTGRSWRNKKPRHLQTDGLRVPRYSYLPFDGLNKTDRKRRPLVNEFIFTISVLNRQF